jgi:cell division protein FtsI (penicillin-binding protein 3)
MGPAKINWEPVRRENVRNLKRARTAICVLLAVVLVRAFLVQVLKLPDLRDQMPIYTGRKALVAKRGLIYDRNMTILAMDVPAYSAAIDATVIGHPERAAGQLSGILGGDSEATLSFIQANRNNAFVWLKKELTRREKEGLEELGLRGVLIRQDTKRAHPCPSIACTVLGGINASRQGVGGVEQFMNSVLRGDDGWQILQRDGKDRNHASSDCPSVSPRNGMNVVLTLDETEQAIVEEELERGVLALRAKGGMAILMDPLSGEILSMATAYEPGAGQPDFGSEYLGANRAVQSEFEPGSTLKVITAAAAIEEGIVTPNSLIHCENGSYRISGQVIHDHDKRYGALTVSKVIELSSNIGVAKIAKKLGKKTLYQYMQNFGLGMNTGIELPGEAPGTMHPIHQWNDFTTATAAYGQGLSVTALQLACMMSVLANGGTLVKPRVILSVVNEDGDVIRSSGREVIRRVISEATAAQMRGILEKTVTQGNAREASVRGVRVGGKTGTAQKSLQGSVGYTPGVYTSSFAGFWPVDSPRYVLVVVLEEPKGSYYAAQSCAPIFSNVVKRMTGLPSSPIGPEEFREEAPQADRRFVFSNYQESVPPAAPPAGRGETEPDDPFTVPRLTGLSLRQALQKLAVRGIQAGVEGSGVVREQSPGPGEKVTADLVCKLICR